MNVFTILRPDVSPKTGRQMFVYFECRYPSIDLLARDLNDGIIVAGTHLLTRWTEERNVVEVVDRKPAAFGKPGVASIETPWVRFVEYDDT